MPYNEADVTQHNDRHVMKMVREYMENKMSEFHYILNFVLLGLPTLVMELDFETCRSEARRAESGVGFLRGGSEPPSPPPSGLESAVSSSSEKFRFWSILGPQKYNTIQYNTIQ